MSTRRALLVTFVTTSLAACTGTTSPSSQIVHETQDPSEPSPILPATPVTPVEAEPPAPLAGCARVGIGLDLNALPTGSSAASIDGYTRTRAAEFTALAPDDVTVELGFYSGVSVFEASLRAASNDRAIEQCNVMTAAFIPTVPGRPGSRESGGSVHEPCGPCPETCPDAYTLAVAWAKQKWPDSNVGRDAFEPGDSIEPIDLDRDGIPDLVLRHGSGSRNATHLVFWMRGGCPTYVGEFPASPLFGYACLTETHNGLCDLTASELMIHGEDQRSTYRFDGTSYQR